MDLKEYRQLIDDFYETTAIDRPPQAAIDGWFNHLSFLNLQVLSGALNHLKIELHRKPYNMLNTIREAAALYKREHPDANTKPDYGECEDCNGEGHFFVKYAANGGSEKKQSAIILCGSCENWKKKFGTTRGFLRMKKFEAQYQGYEVQK